MNVRDREEFAVMKNELGHIKTDVADIKEAINKHIEWEAEKYEALDKKFANKWVEKGILVIATSVIAGAILLILQGGL